MIELQGRKRTLESNLLAGGMPCEQGAMRD